MTWWQLAPAVLATAAMVFLPGYLILRCWAVTGLVAVGTAAPVSIGLMAMCAIAGPYVGVRWGIPLVAVPAVAIAAIGLVLRKATPRAMGIHGRIRRSPRSRWTLLAHLGALLIPAALITRGLTRMIGAPENISQTYDNVFHLNSIRYILDTGSGSTLTLGGMYSAGEKPSTYPAAWHDLVALVVQTTGVSIPAAINAVTLVVGALVWPISAIFLATRVTGTRPVPVLFAGALSSVFGAFPYLMVDFGVLYPYFLSLALLPVALGLVAMATGVGERNGTPRWLATVIFLAATPAVALSHPSTFLTLLLFALPIFVVAVVRYRRILAGRAGAGRYWLLVSLLVAYLLAALALWVRVRPTAEASGWQPIQTIPQAIGQVLTGGLMDGGPSWVVFGLTMVAVGLAMRRQFSQWVFGVYLIAAALFVVVSAVDRPALRDFLTGVWYNDSFRLAALVPLIAVVVCTISGTWLFLRTRDALVERYPRLARVKFTRESTPAAAGVAFVVAAIVGVVGQYSAVNYTVAFAQVDYQPQGEAPLLSPDERALLSRLDEHVPADARIIGNPWTGTALSYAFSGRRTLTPHLAESSIPPDARALMDGLGRLGSDSGLCELVRENDAYYVLDFDGRVFWNWPTVFPGLLTVDSNPGLEEVDRQGEAALYRITACGAEG
ncbi:DUF6541 family protein [Actinokineospora sp. UTMC 2448]|uniref:DUF6541 family protein n=1 Tax=Actinokineospora sp. UTMC 2448 TaxID=2268449 RepID=UPI002164AF90|nr:DUF6541 family protein [Actinokineospora sp. UTMC 2448]UVS82445.1 hypothetical protein Actkin_06218 [Actinokineospora sp. UTMC 2448]